MIWKLTNEQQLLANEISIFKHWLSFKAFVPSCTFQDLGLNKINHIIIQHIFNPTISILTNVTSNSSNTADLCTANLIQEITNSIDKIIQDYQDRIHQIKSKLQYIKENMKKPEINIDKVIQAIEQREINMKQRAQQQIEYKIKFLFQEIATYPSNS